MNYPTLLKPVEWHGASILSELIPRALPWCEVATVSLLDVRSRRCLRAADGMGRTGTNAASAVAEKTSQSGYAKRGRCDHGLILTTVAEAAMMAARAG